MSSLLTQQFPHLLQTLHDNVAYKDETLLPSLPSFRFSELLEIFKLKPEVVSSSLMEISSEFLESITLFDYFRKREQSRPVKVWTTHYNNACTPKQAPLSLFFF